MQLSRKHHNLYYTYGFRIRASSNSCSFHKEPTVHCTMNSLTFEIKKYPEIAVEDKMNKGFCRNGWCFLGFILANSCHLKKRPIKLQDPFLIVEQHAGNDRSINHYLVTKCYSWVMEQLLCSSKDKIPTRQHRTSESCSCSASRAQSGDTD